MGAPPHLAAGPLEDDEKELRVIGDGIDVKYFLYFARRSSSGPGQGNFVGSLSFNMYPYLLFLKNISSVLEAVLFPHGEGRYVPIPALLLFLAALEPVLGVTLNILLPVSRAKRGGCQNGKMAGSDQPSPTGGVALTGCRFCRSYIASKMEVPRDLSLFTLAAHRITRVPPILRYYTTPELVEVRRTSPTFRTDMPPSSRTHTYP